MKGLPRFPSPALLPFEELSEGAPDKRRILTVRTDVVRSLKRSAEMQVDRILCQDFVNVVALTERDGAQQLVVVRQWRFGQRDFSLGLPGGLVDDGEAARAAALRELLEETGYAAEREDDVVDLGFSHPNPAIMTNVCGHFLVRRAVRVADPHLDENEELEVLHLPVDQLEAAVREQELTDALTLAALLRWRMLSS